MNPPCMGEREQEKFLLPDASLRISCGFSETKALPAPEVCFQDFRLPCVLPEHSRRTGPLHQFLKHTSGAATPWFQRIRERFLSRVCSRFFPARVHPMQGRIQRKLFRPKRAMLPWWENPARCHGFSGLRIRRGSLAGAVEIPRASGLQDTANLEHAPQAFSAAHSLHCSQR